MCTPAVPRVSFAGRINVKLMIAKFSGRERVFARVDGNTRAGDQVWLGWSYKAGRSGTGAARDAPVGNAPRG
jgi:hypothetical protein